MRKISEAEWWIERLDPSTGESERVVRTRPGREDHAWTPGGEILMGDGGALHAWTSERGWHEVAGVGGEASGQDAPGDISRVAVSADGSLIALVRSR